MQLKLENTVWPSFLSRLYLVHPSHSLCSLLFSLGFVVEFSPSLVFLCFLPCLLPFTKVHTLLLIHSFVPLRSFFVSPSRLISQPPILLLVFHLVSLSPTSRVFSLARLLSHLLIHRLISPPSFSHSSSLLPSLSISPPCLISLSHHLAPLCNHLPSSSCLRHCSFLLSRSLIPSSSRPLED